ncbi:phycoerythrobilin:ferredoxin oxidoreductase [Prochlorococcus marinus str. MIT 9515]|uniref:15,16-dihydrobiliverdin:ferredoxin oxidoreductase n=1 Tax=Prochlorococcus marinus (strain MIT 9515) TaxID=167542 RepID=PEBA_PROM5|nr:15,16-dihydrobiliverdin:ferredoxin oxidoreductase [Prochlorococcus marinus]A2BYX6.1 RecName: Full=15,16-dihydrobiliverdin:ferredoxin oxidoreductase [Prochlorococcus marinus str. MIT 9515]ABM72987.1 phycoerythrobilin:ferredoxin oxidoreductase [Prochlorococcus marinus str. MIT 9515]
MFDSLKNFLKKSIEDLDGKELEISKEFQEYHNKDSKYIIKNWLFESPQYRKWRVTKLDGGDKLQVFNTVAYPNFKSESPILGADILWFGTSQKLLAIFDYQPLIQEKKYLYQYCSSLDFIKKKYSVFDNNKMKNIYDSKKYFSPWVMICRGNKLNLDRDLNSIFYLFVSDYLRINKLNQNNQFLNYEQIKNKQIDYDKYSAEKDPADKLFKSFFGENWTCNFINNFLFTLNNYSKD